MNKYQHYAIQRSELPTWWDELPRQLLIDFKLQIDNAIQHGSSTVILTRAISELICIAALSEAGVDLAKGIAISIAENLGKEVDIITITPSNYDAWFNEVIK